MNAVRKVLVIDDEPTIDTNFNRVLHLAKLPQAAVAAAQPAAETTGRTIAVILKDVFMFLAAPFIGLAFIALFPIIGLATLIWTGGRALFGRAAAG